MLLVDVHGGDDESDENREGKTQEAAPPGAVSSPPKQSNSNSVWFVLQPEPNQPSTLKRVCYHNNSNLSSLHKSYKFDSDPPIGGKKITVRNEVILS